MIVSIASTKGGVGKTTIAVNLAVARLAPRNTVLLVDGDEQGSAAGFTSLRQPSGFDLLWHPGAGLRDQVRSAASRYDDTVIDVGGTDTGSLRAALLVSDLVAIPVLPRAIDIWATEQMIGLVREARKYNPELRACMFLNFSEPFGRADREAIEVLKGFDDVDLCRQKIGQRKYLAVGIGEGKSILELTFPAEIVKGQVEIRRLATELFGVY